MKKKINYTCSRCGKKAVLGEHFCKSEDVLSFQNKKNYNPDADLSYSAGETELKESKFDRKNLYAGASLTAILILVAFLYSTVGNSALWLLLVAGFVALIFFTRKNFEGFMPNPYQELLRLCHGDSYLAERLIYAEMNRLDGLNRKEAISRAKERLLHDRSR